ncbi:MAG: hypothetical protein M0Q88_02770 [Bacilli bacterium]|nr:hypothetical protein [Bacilli bacterium]
MTNNFISISNKEEELLRLIANVGCFIKPYENKLLISRHIVNGLVKSGLVVDQFSCLLYTKIFKVFTLTNSGKEFVKNKYLISPYMTKLRNVEHDYILGNIYLNLSKEERLTWTTEMALHNKYPNSTVIDGLYINSKSETVGIEVITENYSEEEIKGKEFFLSKHCDKKIVIHSKDVFGKR